MIKSGTTNGAAAARHARILTGIKLLHLAVWLFMVACILLIPCAALGKHFELSTILTGIILIECAVLAGNRGKCPLTSLASRYTEDRSDNFDIFLPLWLARHNKLIFGTLFLCALVRWLST